MRRILAAIALALAVTVGAWSVPTMAKEGPHDKGEHKHETKLDHEHDGYK